MLNMYWAAPDVEMWIDSTHVGDLAFKQWVQGNFKPLSYEPNLSGYYTRSQVDSISSMLAPKDSVFSKEESDGRYMSIDHQIDLSSYYTRYESDAITSNFAVRDYVYSKSESNQLFKPLSWMPDLSQYALKTDLGDFMPSSIIYDTFALSNNVYTISQSDGLFALKTDLDEIGLAFYTKEQSDARYMPITYTPEEVDLSPYLLRTTADELYKSLSYEPNPQVWALKSDLLDFLPFPLAQQLYYERNEIDSIFATKDFLSQNHYTKGQSDNLLSNYWLKSETNGVYVQPSALGNYYTKSQSDSLYLQPSALTNYWNKGESDALYVQPSVLTNYWNKGDSDARYLRVGSPLLAGANVALQYNTLFLALDGDQNHYISHGLSNTALTNYNIDGVVVQGGIQGGILGQTGTTALRWLNGVVTIPGTLKVSGGVDLEEISLPPLKGSDTRPAFQVQAFMHDNMNIYFDANWDGTDLKASFGSFFKISKFNGNLWIGGGSSAIGSIANMTNFIQMSPSGLITLSNSSADALTIYGGLKVNASIYSGGNKVATESFVNSTVSTSKPWESKNSMELNSDATSDS
ncbi:hypothetical protein HK104_006714, partial [Borealophlyctis nickersoniae]